MSDRQIEKRKRRIENRIEELTRNIVNLDLKGYWDEIDVFNHVSMYNEMKDLRNVLIQLG